MATASASQTFKRVAPPTLSVPWNTFSGLMHEISQPSCIFSGQPCAIHLLTSLHSHDPFLLHLGVRLAWFAPPGGGTLRRRTDWAWRSQKGPTPAFRVKRAAKLPSTAQLHGALGAGLQVTRLCCKSSMCPHACWHLLLFERVFHAVSSGAFARLVMRSSSMFFSFLAQPSRQPSASVVSARRCGSSW